MYQVTNMRWQVLLRVKYYYAIHTCRTHIAEKSKTWVSCSTVCGRITYNVNVMYVQVLVVYAHVDRTTTHKRISTYIGRVHENLRNSIKHARWLDLREMIALNTKLAIAI